MLVGASLIVGASATLWKWTGQDPQQDPLWINSGNWCIQDPNDPSTCNPPEDGKFPNSADDDVILDQSSDKNLAALDNRAGNPITLKSITCVSGGPTLTIKTLNLTLVGALTATDCTGVTIDLGGLSYSLTAQNVTINGPASTIFASGLLNAPVYVVGPDAKLQITSSPVNAGEARAFSTKYIMQDMYAQRQGTVEINNDQSGAGEVRFLGAASLHNDGGVLSAIGSGTTRIYAKNGMITGDSFDVSGTDVQFMDAIFQLGTLTVNGGGQLSILSGGKADKVVINGKLSSQAKVTSGGVEFGTVSGGGTLQTTLAADAARTSLIVRNSISQLSSLELNSLTGDTIEIHGTNTLGSVTFTNPSRLTIPDDGSSLRVTTVTLEQKGAGYLKGKFVIDTLIVKTVAVWSIDEYSDVTVNKLFTSTVAGTLHMGSQAAGAVLRVPSTATMQFEHPFTIDANARNREGSVIYHDGVLSVDLKTEDPIYGYSVTIKNLKLISSSGRNMTGMKAKVYTGHLSLVNDVFSVESVVLQSTEGYFDGKQCGLNIGNIGASTDDIHVVLNVSNVIVACPRDCGRVGGITADIFNFSAKSNAAPPGAEPLVPLAPPPPTPVAPSPVTPGGSSSGNGAVIGWVVGIIIGLVVGLLVGGGGMYLYSRRAGYESVEGYRRSEL